MNVALSGGRLGCEVLVDLARSRSDAVVLWERAGGAVRLFVRGGRVEEIADAHGKKTSERADVVRALRGLACADEGRLTLEPGVDGPRGLSLDTLGESLVAVLSSISAEQLTRLRSARGGITVGAASAFDKLAAAVSKMSGQALPRPLQPLPLNEAMNGSLMAQRAWAALYLLGGLSEQAPVAAAVAPLSGSDAEIEAVFQKLPSQTHYQVLGLSPQASADDIRKAYFELAKRWHSDSFVGVDLGAMREKVEAIFRRVGEAHTVLSDAEQRKGYDFVLQRKAQGLPTDAGEILEAEQLFKRAEGLVRRGQPQAAVPLLERAIELNKGEPEFFVYLGFALYSANGHDALQQARTHIQTGLKIQDKIDVAYEFLGRIAHTEGENEQAVRHLRRALELNPKNRDAERELRLITARAVRGGGAQSLPELLGRWFKR